MNGNRRKGKKRGREGKGKGKGNGREAKEEEKKRKKKKFQSTVPPVRVYSFSSTSSPPGRKMVGKERKPLLHRIPSKIQDPSKNKIFLKKKV